MSPGRRAFLARITLAAGVALVTAYVASSAPQTQTIVVRLGERAWTRVDGVIMKPGEDEPLAGFSREFPEPSESDAGAARRRTIRHVFSAPNGTYTLIMTLRERASGDSNPIPIETTWQRQVSLSGGEVNISPD